MNSWCITKVFDPADKRFIGRIGPRNAMLTSVEAIRQHPDAKKFRLVCDDYPEEGNIMAEGWFVGEDEFAPLDNFGEGNWGCSMILYWTPGKGGGWKQL